VIKALVFVYGHDSENANWGEWEFQQLPNAGDYISLSLPDGIHSLTVQHVEHEPRPSDRPEAREPQAVLVTDWMTVRPLQD
jgi:hypothetical protein